MYAQNQMKIPPVRPRSSLSHVHIIEHRKDSGSSHQHKNAVLTLAGLSLFLFLLCCFLLGTLIYIGRRMAEEKATIKYFNDEHWPVTFDNLRHTTKPILRLTSASPSVTQNSINNNKMKIEVTNTMPLSNVIEKLSHILPRDFIRPHKYLLKLQPNLLKKTFTGHVEVFVQILKPIDYIPIHAKYLVVTTDEVLQLDENGTTIRSITPTATYQYPKFEYWITQFDAPLEIGNYSLRFSFNGSLTDRIVGLYQSSYLKDINGNRELRSIATSKFEPTYARQAFPCFDEPAMKAVFNITIVRPTGDGYHALSNMNIESEKNMGDFTEVNFAESVLMSTYLVCFIVSDFANKKKMIKDVLENGREFELRVFSTEAQVDKVDYALRTGAAITEYYIKYFNIPYPLPKLDMAAIPDFVSGAMEHWGLITYRETALLYDTKTSSSANKQRVATVIAHELAHSWFGNLVTMKWWNDLWLNEGFASYIEYKGVHEVHPEWQMLDQFLVETLHSVMKLDSTLAAHPIVQKVESPNEITELFDSITYSKGASIIRMLEDLVGPEKFQNATTQYLNKYSYQNAETDDFLTEIESLNFDFDVKLIMETWTVQMGLPVVEVTKSENGYKLTQKRFFSNPEDYNNKAVSESQFYYHWTIPITYFTSDNNSTVNRLMFNYNDNEITLELSRSVDWIKINKNQVGFYRVNYPMENWRALISALNATKDAFSVADRAHLINDAFALADASQLSFDVALDLTTYLKNEIDYIPWKVAITNLKSIRNLIYYTPTYNQFAVYVKELLNSVYESVTWDVGEDHLQNRLRVTVLDTACSFGHEKALEEAANLFEAWLKNPNDRPTPDLRSIVYYYGMKKIGDRKSWDEVWQIFLDEQDAQEKLKLMEALAAIQDPLLLQRYIELAWIETNVRGQDYFTCLKMIATNQVGQGLVWDYVREKWPQLVKRFGINERYLGRLLPAITRRFATVTKLRELETFFENYPEAGAGAAARKQALENVKYNIKWLEANMQQVKNWLENRNIKNVK